MKAKKYIGIYKDELGNTRNMVQTDYTSKKDFAYDLRANGYRVIIVLTKEQIEMVKNYDVLNDTEEERKFIGKLYRLNRDLIEYIEEVL